MFRIDIINNWWLGIPWKIMQICFSFQGYSIGIFLRKLIFAGITLDLSCFSESQHFLTRASTYTNQMIGKKNNDS